MKNSEEIIESQQYYIIIDNNTYKVLYLAIVRIENKRVICSNELLCAPNRVFYTFQSQRCNPEHYQFPEGKIINITQQEYDLIYKFADGLYKDINFTRNYIMTYKTPPPSKYAICFFHTQVGLIQYYKYINDDWYKCCEQISLHGNFEEGYLDGGFVYFEPPVKQALKFKDFEDPKLFYFEDFSDFQSILDVFRDNIKFLKDFIKYIIKRRTFRN